MLPRKDGFQQQSAEDDGCGDPSENRKLWIWGHAAGSSRRAATRSFATNLNVK